MPTPARRIWTNDQLADVLHLLGVVEQNLIVSGNRLWSLDVRIGQRPIRLAGERARRHSRHGPRRRRRRRNLLADAQRDLRRSMPVTGARTRSPISLGSVSDGGANLAAADGRLIVAGHDKLIAFGPPTSRQRNEQDRSNRSQCGLVA